MTNPRTITTTQSSISKQPFAEKERKGSQNFKNTLDLTNLDSDSGYKANLKNSSLSRLGNTSSARLESSYKFTIAKRFKRLYTMSDSENKDNYDVKSPSGKSKNK
ncbi:2372_t:CDS:2 [Funneliformis caledonium]|uniref:2372_t:CDS:1 n=1 Tax=Funneliformis caledonium TaxID=1117310 RepID=A0A9N9CCU4_9GLOM|nr:2372_t:CDS:2 [Funneliformis caledonium]